MKSKQLPRAIKFFGVFLLVGLVSLSAIGGATTSAFAETDSSISEIAETDSNTSEKVGVEINSKKLESICVYDVESLTKSMFGDVEIESSEYLYNLDGSSDYIYVEFKYGGYAIYYKDSKELLEYSAEGTLSFPKSNAKKYYGGPSAYFIKQNNCFVDTITGEYLDITLESAQAYSKEVRNLISNKYESIKDQISFEFDYSSLDSNPLNVENELTETSLTKYEVEETEGGSPSYDRKKLIRVSGGTYLPNYQYFLSEPLHGQNSTGTCGAVATQLMLSYNNYYNDRRIIADNYLNGDSGNPQRNPNLCTDPMLMNSYTLGTRGYYEDGRDDANSYFKYVVDNVPANCTMSTLKNGLSKILSERNKELGGTIDYSIGTKAGKWWFGWKPVESSGIISEIDAGRPTLILMQASLGGTNHYVVAYGYTNYLYPNTNIGYLGYITHFGWKTTSEGNFVNIWVNSSWCESYLTLKINHTHDYSVNVGQIGENANIGRYERKCGVCGHRTDDVIIFGENDRYVERRVVLPQNGYKFKDFKITFKSGGKKLFQTFGSENTCLYLYSSEGRLLASNKDSGYMQNALFRYNVQADITYKLRVCFDDNSIKGETKIGIMPFMYSVDKYEKFDGIFRPGGMTAGTTLADYVIVTRYCVDVEGTYMFYTQKYRYSDEITDMYLYLIDPTSTEPCWFNDDGAGNLQAKIEAIMKPGIEYILITTTYNIHNNGDYELFFASVY